MYSVNDEEYVMIPLSEEYFEFTTDGNSVNWDRLINC